MYLFIHTHRYLFLSILIDTVLNVCSNWYSARENRLEESFRARSSAAALSSGRNFLPKSLELAFGGVVLGFRVQHLGFRSGV